MLNKRVYYIKVRTTGEWTVRTDAEGTIWHDTHSEAYWVAQNMRHNGIKALVCVLLD